MLVSFYGKLPHYPEFLTSDNPPMWSKSVINWMIQGQGQLGEVILKQSNKKSKVYFFMIDGHALPVRVAGIFLASHDSRLREFAFMLFHEHQTQSIELIGSSYHDAMKQACFDVSVLVDMSNDELLDGYKSFLQRADVLSDEGIWQNVFCDSERLISTQLNSTLYRKLIMSS